MDSVHQTTDIATTSPDQSTGWLAWVILWIAVIAVIVAAATIPAPADPAPMNMKTEHQLWLP